MKSFPKKLIAPPNNQSWFTYITAFIFCVFIILAIRYQIKLLHYFVWEDESETIVAAKMIAAGGSLYSQIFNHHGPLTFLSGVLLEKLGDFGIATHRIPIAILQILALIAIYSSPLLKNNFTRRLFSITAYSVMLLYFSKIYGHMYLYQVVAGLFLIIILAQYTLPAIAYPDSLSSKKTILGNILIASLPFLAITFIPISLVLFFISLRKFFLNKSIIVIVISSIANILFLISIGSIKGFLAFHIYLNLKILPLYSHTPVGFELIKIIFINAVTGLKSFISFLIFAAAIYYLAKSEKSIPWRSILLGLGIISLLVRGNDFQGLPYFYSLLALPLIFFYNHPIINRPFQFIALILLLACIVKLSLIFPSDRRKFISGEIPTSNEFSQLVRIFTKKNDRIIAYNFANSQYIFADRLPASGYFFYLPWQEKYNEHPKLGISINACREISQYRPKIMYINKWKVWDEYSWDSYATCIQEIIDKNYVQVPGRPYYIRKDLLVC